MIDYDDFEFASSTDVGVRRSHNQDALALLPAGDSATFEVRPKNTANMSTVIGQANSFFPEFGALVYSKKRGTGEIFEIDLPRCKGEGIPLHFDEKFGMLKAMGLTENIVHGRFKYAQVGRLVFAFAGYKGRVKKFGVNYRGMDMPNKEITVGGVVTAKRQEDGENLIDLDVWTQDVDGKKTTPGTATVALPSR